MTLQFKQAPLIIVLLALLVGVVLWQPRKPSNRDSHAGRTVPPTPKPAPRDPMVRAKYTPQGVVYGTEEIIQGMNQTAVEHAQKAYNDTMAGFTPRDTRPLSERARDRQKGWHPPVPANK